MSWVPVAIAGGVLAAVALLVPKRPPLGHGAQDSMPMGWTGKPASQNVVKGKSGTVYNVSGWPVNKATNEDYFVAEKQGNPNLWIAYIRNRSTNAKRLFRGSAQNAAQLGVLAADFGVPVSNNYKATKPAAGVNANGTNYQVLTPS